MIEIDRKRSRSIEIAASADGAVERASPAVRRTVRIARWRAACCFLDQNGDGP
jgi:hypothetical protein